MTTRSGYRLVRGLARLLVRLFYRRVDLVGADRIPPAGPLILAANHQNALVDPLLLLAAMPRELRPLAKAPLFGILPLRPFLVLAGAVPVQRLKDTAGDPHRNAAAFAAVDRALQRGEAILIFPEGISHAESQLQPLRTGAARMLLAAAARGGEPALLPVGLVFREPATFRGGWAAILVGEPVATADLVALERSAPEEAARRLTERLAAALRRELVEVDDWRTARLLQVAEGIWRHEVTPLAAGAPRLAWLQQVARAYRYLLPRQPERLETLRRRLEAYAAVLERAGLSGASLDQEYPARVVLRFALREGGAILLGLPLALVGLALHGLPYRLTSAIVRRVAPQPDVVATVKLATGVVAYPLGWAAEAWLAFRFGGQLGLLALLLALLPAGFFALAWRERLDRARRAARGFAAALRRPGLRRLLLERRRELGGELRALAELVPPEVVAASEVRA